MHIYLGMILLVIGGFCAFMTLGAFLEMHDANATEEMRGRAEKSILFLILGTVFSLIFGYLLIA